MNRLKVCLILLLPAFALVAGNLQVVMAAPGDLAHNTHFFDPKGPLIGGEGHCEVCHLSQNGLKPDWDTVVKESCDGCHSVGGNYGGADEAWLNWKNSYWGECDEIPECAEADADESLIYGSDRNLLPGKEKWCASCHDDDPASSKPTPLVVIVDNSDPGASFTGTWGSSSWAPGYYGTDYRYHTAGAGADTFTWTPDIMTSGDYTVYARWTADASRAPDATYTIHHSGSRSPAIVTMDQRYQGGTWVSLGTYSFDGIADYVELVQSPNGYVIADAIKWESGKPCTSAPNISGDDVNFGFYVSGHGKNSENPTECLDCHDSSKPHIDGVHRTYRAGGPTTYSDSYRLRDIDGRPAMNIPRPLYPVNTNPLINWTDFALCFGCHNRFEVLSQNSSVVGKTNFWNDDSSPKNSHNIHLGIYSNHFDSDWDGVADSSESCIACHNVHGSPNQAMIRHGELISCEGADKVPALNFAYLVGTAPGTRDTSAVLGPSIGGNMGYPSASLSQNHVCAACHNAISYYRTPYLGPRVLNPQANPGTVDIGEGPQDVLLSATVTDDVLSEVEVTVDLSAIDGDAHQVMNDQGGGLYTYLATVPITAVPGNHCLVVTAEDDDYTGENTVILTVTKPGGVIVDNLDDGASFTGTWGTSTWSPGFWGTNYHYHVAGAGTDTFTWTPAIATPGIYAVFARWTEDPSRAPDATYTIYHDGDTPTPVVKDQRSQGGEWVFLDTFSFDGIDDYVELVQSPNGYVIADAIMFEQQ